MATLCALHHRLATAATLATAWRARQVVAKMSPWQGRGQPSPGLGPTLPLAAASGRVNFLAPWYNFLSEFRALRLP